MKAILLTVTLTLALTILTLPTHAQSFGTIKTTDFEQAKAATDMPDAKLVELDLKKFKNASGHVILRQFPNRVRVEFEGSRLPPGTYSLRQSSGCTTRAQGIELHRFKSDQAHIATEKSLPKTTLAEIQGKSLSLFRVAQDKYELIDCKLVP